MKFDRMALKDTLKFYMPKPIPWVETGFLIYDLHASYETEVWIFHRFPRGEVVRNVTFSPVDFNWNAPEVIDRIFRSAMIGLIYVPGSEQYCRQPELPFEA